MEENEEEKEEEPIDIKITKQNADIENNENAFDFRWSDVQEEDEKDIDLDNFIKNYKSKLLRKFSQKSN